LIAVQISFFSVSVATVPLKCSLPSRSSAGNHQPINSFIPIDGANPSTRWKEDFGVGSGWIRAERDERREWREASDAGHFHESQAWLARPWQ
jgi:hypothetical protein